MITIYVDTIAEKKELLRQSKYIHDFAKVVKYKNKDEEVKEHLISLDSDKASTLMHIYNNPQIIVVRKRKL